MPFIRPATLNDLDRITEFAFIAQIGLTSLPKNESLLRVRIEKAVESFRKSVAYPNDELYFFVLEDSETAKVMGVSGIKANTGSDHPIVTYSIEKDRNFYWLVPETLRKGYSEVASLFLHRDFRKQGGGRLLSYSRFLFMADFPERFHTQVMANMRGMIDRSGQSLFWNEVSGKFNSCTFQQLMQKLDRQELNYDELAPRYPLCSLFLSPEILESIGKTHVNTVAAINLLKEEGFQVSDHIDLMDGGPLLFADRPAIKTIARSEIKKIEAIDTEEDGDMMIVSNTRIDFRCLVTGVKLLKNGIAIPKKSIELLKLKVGDSVRISPFHFETAV